MRIIKRIDISQNISKYQTVGSYYHLKNETLWWIAIFVAMFIIIANSIYPKPVMDIMEKMGVISYVTLENTRFSDVKGNRGGYKSISGYYKDNDGVEHKAHIICSPTIELTELLGISNTIHLARSHSNISGGFYNFFPDWEFLREANIISIVLFYGVIIISLIVIVRKRNIIKNVFSDINCIEFTSPIGFKEKIVRKKKSHIYGKYLLWRTVRDGDVFDEKPSPYFIDDRYDSSNVELEINDDFRSIYVKNNQGFCIIVENKFLDKVIKKYNFIVIGDSISVNKSLR